MSIETFIVIVVALFKSFGHKRQKKIYNTHFEGLKV